MGPVYYNNRKLRIGAAFVSGLYMLIHATNFDAYRAITTPYFYFVLAVSCGVAVILIEYVHYMTKKLDNRYGWRSQLSTRIIWQTIYGIIIPGILDLFLIGIYFHFLGENILDNGYFQIDFPMVLIFLLILNGYYYTHYHLLTEERKIQKRVSELIEENQYEYNSDDAKEPERLNDNDLSTVDDPIITTENEQPEIESDENVSEHNNLDTLMITHKRLNASFQVKDDIVYFYIHNRKTYAVTVHGNEYPFVMTIAELEEKYRHIGLCRISRNVVMNCNMIRGYTPGPKKGTYIIILKPQFVENLPKDSKQYFFITKEYLEAFKDQFEQI